MIILQICVSGPVKAGKPGKQKLTKAEKKQKKREESRIKAKLSKKGGNATNAGENTTPNPNFFWRLGFMWFIGETDTYCYFISL